MAETNKQIKTISVAVVPSRNNPGLNYLLTQAKAAA